MALALGLVSATTASAPDSSESPSSDNRIGQIGPYLPTSRQTEIDLARSAAPAAISGSADILVFGPKGYELESKGTNGFVCLVQRSWGNDPGEPEFFNSRIRGPICMNAAAARSLLPAYLELTTWVLQGETEDQILSRVKAEVGSGRIVPPEAGAMSYMMSKNGYVSDDDHAWRPHFMIFLPSSISTTSWGANLANSPILGRTSKAQPFTVLYVPLSRWSDGSMGPAPHAPTKAAER
jgi:hypothetical protein